MRKIANFIHRWLGLVFGVFIAVICLTGALMGLQDEIIHAVNRDLYHLNVSEGDKPLEDSVLIARVLPQMPEGLTLLRIEVDDSDPTAVAKARVMELGKSDFLINQYTGEVYGQPWGGKFFQKVKELHRFLLNTPKNYQGGQLSPGRLIVAISTICCSLILISGIVLWWPKNRKMLKTRLQVNTKKGFRRFVYDSHVSLGIYVVLFLLLMSLTGPIKSFKWYEKAARAVTFQTEQQDGRRGGPGPGGFGNNDRKVEVAHMSGAEEQMPPEIQKSMRFQNGFQALHFGTWGGMVTRILYVLAALIGATLPITGYYIWWKRKHPTNKPKESSNE